jgi:arylformamidase
MSRTAIWGEQVNDLDKAYSNADFIPDAEAYPPRWAKAASAFRDGLGNRAELDLLYADRARARFDLFHPEGNPAGTLIFVHGGYWRSFDRTSWSHLAAGALARGWAVAMPSYDLCPDVTIDRITRQIAAAVETVAVRMDGPLALAGHSAGGHLVARMLDPHLITPETASRIRHVMPISPLSDLRPLIGTAMNADFRLDDPAARAESPIFMADRHAVEVTVWVGADERPAFLDQAAWLAEAWGCERVVAADKHHFDVIDDLADPESEMVTRLLG